ncbi:MAG TPA: hypothetical protein VL400_17805 [Polyangiaceae bacterium]|nr:hypothetical protein [Polyangiaceae bacterium]
MSELSDSVHVLDGEVDAVVESLVKAGVTALVLPKVGRHVTVLIRRAEARRWSAVSERPLCAWRFAADHGLEVALFAKGKQQASLARDFDPASGWSLMGAGAWERIGGVSIDRLKTVLAELSSSDVDPHRCAGRVAEVLGLSDVEWIAGRDLRDAEALQDLRALHPRAVYVRAGKRAPWTTPAEADTFEREQREWRATARESVAGAPMLAPPKPPMRRGATKNADPPWSVRGAGEITLDVENFGGAAHGVTVELESDLFARGACEVTRVRLDAADLDAADASGAARRFGDAAVQWRAAANPAEPTPTATHRLRIELCARARDRGTLFVRVAPGASVDARGRLVLGRLLEVAE